MAPFIRPCSEMNPWGGSLKKKDLLPHENHETLDQCDQIYSSKSLVKGHVSSPEDHIHYCHNSSEYSRSTSMSTSTSSSTSSRYAKAVDLSESPAIQSVKVTSVNKDTIFKNATLQRQTRLLPTLVDTPHNASGGDYPNTASLNSLISTLMCRFQPSVGVQGDKSTPQNDLDEARELVNQRNLLTSKCNETEVWMNTNVDPPPVSRNGSMNDASQPKSTLRDPVVNIKQEKISVQASFNKVCSERMQPICASRSITKAQPVVHNIVHRDALVDKVVMANPQHPAITNTHPLFELPDVNASSQPLTRHSVQKRDTISTHQRRPLAPTARWNQVGEGFPVKMHLKHTDRHHEHPPSNYMRDACTEISPSILCKRDMGTQMTPSVGSANSSRRLSPPKRGGGGHKSPLRHNTPVKSSSTECSIAIMSSFQGSRQTTGGDQVQEQQLLGMQSLGPYRNLKVEEHEEEISATSRGPHVGDLYAERDVLDAQTNAWREATRLKVLARYEREELKIRAWEDHQAAKAEAELKKLQIKLERKRMQTAQKIVSKLEAAQRRSEVLRANARVNEMLALESLACEQAKQKPRKDASRSRLQLACLACMR